MRPKSWWIQFWFPKLLQCMCCWSCDFTMFVDVLLIRRSNFDVGRHAHEVNSNNAAGWMSCSNNDLQCCRRECCVHFAKYSSDIQQQSTARRSSIQDASVAGRAGCNEDWWEWEFIDFIKHSGDYFGVGVVSGCGDVSLRGTSVRQSRTTKCNVDCGQSVRMMRFDSSIFLK